MCMIHAIQPKHVAISNPPLSKFNLDILEYLDLWGEFEFCPERGLNCFDIENKKTRWVSHWFSTKI